MGHGDIKPHNILVYGQQAKEQAEVKEFEAGFVPVLKALRAAIETNSVEDVMGELRREVRPLKSPKAR